jgi:hypothetical protein
MPPVRLGGDKLATLSRLDLPCERQLSVVHDAGVGRPVAVHQSEGLVRGKIRQPQGGLGVCQPTESMDVLVQIEHTGDPMFGVRQESDGIRVKRVPTLASVLARCSNQILSTVSARVLVWG